MNVGLVQIKKLDEQTKAKKYSLRQVLKANHILFDIKTQWNFFFIWYQNQYLIKYA